MRRNAHLWMQFKESVDTRRDSHHLAMDGEARLDRGEWQRRQRRPGSHCQSC